MTMTQSAETTLNRDDVLATILELVAAEFELPAGQVSGDAVLKQLPGADSVRLLRVVAKVERRYDVEFEDEDIFRVRTADELAALVLGESSKELT
jgi:acyl carrier protein